MFLGEVLVCKFLSIDGFSASALSKSSVYAGRRLQRLSHISTSEVTSLEHEFGDHTMELRVFVSEALLASAQCAEVLYRFGDNIIEEDEIDATRLSC